MNSEEMKKIRMTLQETNKEINEIISNAKSISEIREKCTEKFYEIYNKEIETIRKKRILVEDYNILNDAFSSAICYDSDSIKVILEPRIKEFKDMLKKRYNKKIELETKNNGFFNFGRNKIKNELVSINKKIDSYRIVDDDVLKVLKEGNKGDFTDEEWKEIGESVKKSITDNKEVSLYSRDREQRISKQVAKKNLAIFEKYNISINDDVNPIIILETISKYIEGKCRMLDINNSEIIKQLESVFRFTENIVKDENKPWKDWTEFGDDEILEYKAYLNEYGKKTPNDEYPKKIKKIPDESYNQADVPDKDATGENDYR